MSSEREKLKKIENALEKINEDNNLEVEDNDLEAKTQRLEKQIIEIRRLKKQIIQLIKKKEYDKKYKKRKLCKTLQKIVSKDVQDPDSIFNKKNAEFLRTITDCKLPLEEIK